MPRHTATILLIILVGCQDPEYACSYNTVLSLVDREHTDELFAQLQTDGIPVEMTAAGALCYPAQYEGQVGQALLDVHSSAPRTRNQALADEIRRRLDDAGIPYRYEQRADGSSSIGLVDLGDSAVFEAIAEEARRAVDSD